MSPQAAEAPSDDYSLDRFLGGSVLLLQPRSGHRAGLDAALLQALLPGDATGEAIDLGAGVGTVGFAAAARAPALSVTCVERDPELVACARSALETPENAGFAARVRVVQSDVTDRRELREQCGNGTADFVLMNPPYDSPERARPSPDARRRSAHVAERGALGAWTGSAAGLLRAGALLGLIHRAAALPDVLEALGASFGDLRIVPVHPFADKPAGRIVVRGRKGSRGDLQLMPGLVLHDAGGGWTEAADAILRGRADFGLR